MPMSSGVSDLRRKGQQGGYTQNGDNNNGGKYGMNGGYNNYNSSSNNGSWANQFNRNDGYQQQHHHAPPRPSNNNRDYDLKGAEQGIQGLSVNSSSNNGQKKSDGGGGGSSKKMTWATVASQPAKPQVTTTSLLVKKKGKGMPPPPMVPGKHNLDIGSWDTPVREPTPPPSPPTPPPVEPTPIPLNAEHQKAIEREEQQQKQRQQYQNGPGGGAGHYGGGGPRDQHYNSQQHQPHNNQYGGYNRDKRPWNRDQGPPQQHQFQNNGRSMGHNNNHYNNGGEQRSGGYRNYNGYNNPRNQSPPPHHQQPQHYRDHSPVQQQHPRDADEHPSQSPPPRGGGGRDRDRDGDYEPHHSQQRGGGRYPAAARNAKLSVSDTEEPEELTQEMLDKVMDANNYNPPQLAVDMGKSARFFVIKSYSEDDIHRSIKYEIWCSTEHGNKRLDQAYREREAADGNVLLFFSVNGSGHFCGIAEMISAVDYNSKSTVWAQDKWRGVFKVKWIYVKDVPNTLLRQIRLENNENKPVTNSRDTQEVPNPQGLQMLDIIHAYQHTTSIFDDFVHYEKRQVEEVSRKHVVVDQPPPQNRDMMMGHNNHHQQRGNYGRGEYQGGRGYNHHNGDRPQYNNRGGYGGGDSYNRRGGYGHRDNNSYEGGNGYNNRDRENYDNNYQQRSFGPREDRDGGNFRRDHRDNNNFRGGRNGGNMMMNNNGGNNRGRWNHAAE